MHFVAPQSLAAVNPAVLYAGHGHVAPDPLPLPLHERTHMMPKARLGPRQEAALLAFSTLVDADKAYRIPQEFVAGPRKAGPGRTQEMATRYLVKKLAYQETTTEKTHPKNLLLSGLLRAAERRAGERCCVLTSCRGLAVGENVVLHHDSPEVDAPQHRDIAPIREGTTPPSTPLSPGAEILRFEATLMSGDTVVITDGEEIAAMVAKNGGERVFRGGVKEDPESDSGNTAAVLKQGCQIVVTFVRPAPQQGGEVVLLDPVELRCKRVGGGGGGGGDTDTTTDDLSFETHYTTTYLARNTFATADSTTPPRGSTSRIKIAVPSTPEHNIFWVDRQCISGIGRLRDFEPQRATPVAVQIKGEDVARLLITAYSDEGSDTLSREDYEDLCRDTGLSDDFDAMKDKATGMVTTRSLRRKADRLLQENEEVLREIALSKRAAKMTLQTSDEVCDAKAGGAAMPTLSSLQADLPAVAKRLSSAFTNKPKGVLEELCWNLVAPPHVDKLLLLSEAAAQLARTKGGLYPGKCKVQLLLMVLYTMSGPDIDALMGYNDVPDYAKEKEKWKAYTEENKDRNKALFSEVNGLMRGVADIAKCDWRAVSRWVKCICHLHALCTSSRQTDCTRTPLSRGITGLPGSVVSAHTLLKPGDSFTWTAPSSCAVDPKIAVDYLMGNAANAQTPGSGGGAKGERDSILFSVEGKIPALALSSISKYPKEAEMLVPPLSSLRLKKAVSGTPHAGCIKLQSEWQSAAALDTIQTALTKEASEGSSAMDRRSSQKDDRVKKFLLTQRRHMEPPPWLPTSPRPGFVAANPPPPTADHQMVNSIVCANVLASTSPKRQR